MVKNAKNNVVLNVVNYLGYSGLLFLLGFVIAIIASFLDLDQGSVKVVLLILVVIGVLVGFLNWQRENTVSFLVGSLALVILMSPYVTVQGSAQVFGVNVISYLFQSVFQSVDAFQISMKISVFVIGLVIPASLVVSLKTIFLKK